MPLLMLAAACGEKGDATLDRIATDYARAALALDRNDPGFVDAWFGPPEWKDEAEAGEPASLEELAARVTALRRELAGLDSTLLRVAFIDGQLTAMETRIRMLRGELLSFEDEVEGLYGHRPSRFPEEALADAHRRLETLLPGGGDLADRLRRYDRTFLVPTERILSLFEIAAEECRSRASSLVPLPEQERLNLSLVSDRPWGAYNWYQGNGVSNIEINTDLPRRVSTLLHYVAHEAYPGHHTELSVRDVLLAQGEGWAEYTLSPLYSPQSFISEGGADLGIEMIFAPEEVADFYRSTVLPAAGIEGVDAELMLAIGRVRAELDHAAENAAFMLFSDGASDQEAAAYLQRWALMTAEEATKRVSFIRAYRGYIFNYRTGYEAVRRFVFGGDPSLSVRRQRFRHIWTTPVTPELLRRWTAADPD